MARLLKSRVWLFKMKIETEAGLKMVLMMFLVALLISVVTGSRFYGSAFLIGGGSSIFLLRWFYKHVLKQRRKVRKGG